MKQLLVKFLLPFLCTWYTGECFAAEEQLVVGWGDSLTEGLCNRGYTVPLDEQMEENGRPVQMINCGVGGEMSHTSLDRLQETLLCDDLAQDRGYCSIDGDKYIWAACDGRIWSRDGWYDDLNGERPDFILLWTGANDQIHAVSYQTTLYNIKEMIKVSREFEVTPLIATVTPDAKYNYPDCREGSLGKLNDGIAALSVSEDVELADQCATIPVWTNDDCGDGLHPNSRGNEKIAATWLQVLPERSDFTEAILTLTGSYLLLLGK
jgi:lysophospholipase L1-like esterase